jgi:deazaflavin-dependent oxidoreductase (nitroreductase family)
MDNPDLHGMEAAGRPRLTAPLHRLSVPLGDLGRPLAGSRWIPLYGILRHVGRTSGTAYATPVVALRVRDCFLIPLPFGDRTQWAKNLFAAGGAGLRSRGQEDRIADPEVVTTESVAADLPILVRTATRAFGLRQFVRVRIAD